MLHRGHANPDGDRDADDHPDANRDRDSDDNANVDANPDADRDLDQHRDANQFVDGNRYLNGNGDVDSDGNSHVYADAKQYVDSERNAHPGSALLTHASASYGIRRERHPHVDRKPNGDAYGHADEHADCNPVGDGDRESYVDCIANRVRHPNRVQHADNNGLADGLAHRDPNVDGHDYDDRDEFADSGADLPAAGDTNPGAAHLDLPGIPP